MVERADLLLDTEWVLIQPSLPTALFQAWHIHDQQGIDHMQQINERPLSGTAETH